MKKNFKEKSKRKYLRVRRTSWAKGHLSRKMKKKLKSSPESEIEMLPTNNEDGSLMDVDCSTDNMTTDTPGVTSLSTDFAEKNAVTSSGSVQENITTVRIRRQCKSAMDVVLNEKKSFRAAHESHDIVKALHVFGHAAELRAQSKIGFPETKNTPHFHSKECETDVIMGAGVNPPLDVTKNDNEENVELNTITSEKASAFRKSLILWPPRGKVKTEEHLREPVKPEFDLVSPM